MIEVRLATYRDIGFLIDCFNASWKVNDHDSPFLGLEDPDGPNPTVQQALFFNLEDQLRDHPYIVERDGVAIGFFTQDRDFNNMHLGGTVYVAPHACRMAITYILKACVVRGVYMAIDNKFEYIEFNTWHDMIIRVVKNLLPELKVHTLYDTYKICIAPVSEIEAGEGYRNVLNIPKDMTNDKELPHYTFRLYIG